MARDVKRMAPEERAEMARRLGRRTCCALGCSVPVGAERGMCRVHWRMVPRRIQARIWATLEQQRLEPPDAPMLPSRRATWRAAIRAVARKERRPLPGDQGELDLKPGGSR